MTQGDNNHPVVFCALGATIMCVSCQSNLYLSQCTSCGGHMLIQFNEYFSNVPNTFISGSGSSCVANSNQRPVSLWISGITCWKTDRGTNLMGWCVTPAKTLPVTPKNVRAAVPLPLPSLLPCSLFMAFPVNYESTHPDFSL